MTAYRTSQALEVVPLSGLLPIRFGMTPSQVGALMGEDYAYEDWMGGNLNDALLYHGLVFEFDLCDSHGPLPNARLGSVQVKARRNVILQGRPLADLVLQDLLSLGHTNRWFSGDLPGAPDFFLPDLGFEVCFDTEGRFDSAGLWLPAPAFRRNT